MVKEMFVVDRCPWEFKYKLGFARREDGTVYVAQGATMKEKKKAMR